MQGFVRGVWGVMRGVGATVRVWSCLDLVTSVSRGIYVAGTIFCCCLVSGYREGTVFLSGLCNVGGG